MNNSSEQVFLRLLLVFGWLLTVACSIYNLMIIIHAVRRDNWHIFFLNYCMIIDCCNELESIRLYFGMDC